MPNYCTSERQTQKTGRATTPKSMAGRHPRTYGKTRRIP